MKPKVSARKVGANKDARAAYIVATPVTGPRRTSRFLFIVGLVAASLLCLAGRYDWRPPARAGSIQAFVSSAYLLVIILPVAYFAVDRFLNNRRLARLVAAAAAIVFALPYRWLGLDGFNFLKRQNRPRSWASNAPALPDPQLDWLFEGAPAVHLILAILFILAAMGAAFWWHKRSVWRSPFASRRALWLGICVLVLVQTGLHLSMRSPYTYGGHYRKSPAENYYYHVYTLPNAQGAVNEDYFAFWSTEALFDGTTHDPGYNTVLFRRSLPGYIVSQFSYFAPDFYVWLFFNVVMWLTACYCGYAFAKRVWDENVAAYFAVLIASGPGFIMYVAQPATYLAGYSAVIVLVCLFEVLVVGDKKAALSDSVLFGAFLGLALLVYDVFSMYVFFLAYCILRRASLIRTVLSLAAGASIYAGFLFVLYSVLRVPNNTFNSEYIGRSLSATFSLFAKPQFSRLYEAAVDFSGAYVDHLSHAFFVVPVVLGAAGLHLFRQKREVGTILLLFVPSLLTFAVLRLGGTELGDWPRFSYIAYPALYLLCAMALARLRDMSRAALAWAIVAVIIFLSNADIFGYPMLYYRFYFAHGGVW